MHAASQSLWFPNQSAISLHSAEQDSANIEQSAYSCQKCEHEKHWQKIFPYLKKLIPAVVSILIAGWVCHFCSDFL